MSVLILTVCGAGMLAGGLAAPTQPATVHASGKLSAVQLDGAIAQTAPSDSPTQAGQAKETGPRLTDPELLDALDLRYPGLEAVAQALAAQERGKALAELAHFLRQRQEPFDFGQKRSPDPGYDRSSADDVLRHRFTVGGIPHTFESGIEWLFNPTTVTGSQYPADHEWTWQFNRHGAWWTLAAAFGATGDEKYAREFAAQLESWLRDCPVPQGRAWQGPTSPWRTIECGIRTAGSWATAFTVFRSAPALSDRLLLDWLKSWIEHGRYLQAHPTGRNWLTMEMNGLYQVGTLKMFAYNLWAMTPDRSLARWNDSWHVDVPGLLAEGAALYPHRRDFLWVATDGQQGTRPDHLSHLKQPQEFGFKTTDRFDFARGAYDDGFGRGIQARHVREVLLHGRRGVRPIPCLIHARTGRALQFLTVLQPVKSADAARVRSVGRRNAQVVLTWDDGRETAVPWP